MAAHGAVLAEGDVVQIVQSVPRVTLDTMFSHLAYAAFVLGIAFVLFS